MPTISINRKDFEQLLGKTAATHEPVTAEMIESWLCLVKGELKDHDQKTDEMRVELQDSNRPDLWSCEGIVRQVRTKLNGSLSPYAFFHACPRPERRLLVSPGLEEVRPFVAACSAVGYEVTDAGLIQLIQVQEKLAEIFGRQRRTVSIGLYRLPKIVFPVRYTLVKPDEARFTPLGCDEPMLLREILALHPKGIEYGPILSGHECVPLLQDDDGQVLSFPPIINSREIGEVRVGDRELFVEVTGTDLSMVLLTLNILAVNLADRGAAIETLEVVYPSETTLGKTIRTPLDLSRPRSIPMTAIESALGQQMEPDQIRSALVTYGYEVSLAQEALSVKLPPYRNDVMHPIDVVEDVAISCGYGAFTPVLPSAFTVGGLSALEQVADRIRDLMVGSGCQEIISNILGARTDAIDRMRLSGSEWDRVVEVDNVMSQSFACLRPSILPSLLRVESVSTRAFYPHRLFEVGEIVIPDRNHEFGGRTMMAAGALLAHAAANFSEIHSCLDLLLYYLGYSYQLEPASHPSFLAGRIGRIVCDGQNLGIIGEIHPEVLEHWQVTMPCVAFELHIDPLAAQLGRE
ncbi:MAG TPA: phenylalanine--tRNA ligase subunit beta [Nitrospiraceae bacterium]|nr:phenylalanine--tRNA ligase subunit beta [Nitrospiraceae bacterium]